MSEFIARFATSRERRIILAGLLNYRAALREVGILNGFQWIDGSFVEDCERTRGRPPGDIDVVSFVRRPEEYQDDNSWETLIVAQSRLFNSQLAKVDFHCDAYITEIGQDEPELLIEQSSYWFGLFSHQRLSFGWKGMLRVSLASDDLLARNILEEPIP